MGKLQMIIEDSTHSLKSQRWYASPHQPKLNILTCCINREGSPWVGAISQQESQAFLLVGSKPEAKALFTLSSLCSEPDFSLTTRMNFHSTLHHRQRAGCPFCVSGEAFPCITWSHHAPELCLPAGTLPACKVGVVSAQCQALTGDKDGSEEEKVWERKHWADLSYIFQNCQRNPNESW